MIRKVQFAPDTDAAAPSVETTRDFVMSDKPLHVKTGLDKEVRGHAGSLTCRFKHLPQEPRWESPVQMVVRAYASCKVTFLLVFLGVT